MKPHIHAEVIKAWADGAIIECRSDPADDWEVVHKPRWYDTIEYRVKPEREYPKTSLTGNELFTAFHLSKGSSEEGLFEVANAAIKRYIQDTERE